MIAFAKGGALETISGVKSGVVSNVNSDFTGVFFEQQTALSLKNAIEYFEKNIELFKPVSCVKNAQRFSNERFHNEFKDFVLSKYQAYRSQMGI